MTIELIYDRDCPNAGRARANLASALVSAGREARWTEWNLGTPENPAHTTGYGSPTILVNGKDVAGEVPGGEGPCCRLYRNAATGFDGTPSIEQIIAALSARYGTNDEAGPE